MDSISIDFDNYKLQVSIVNEKLHLKLVPLEYYDKNRRYYSYEAIYQNQSIPENLRLFFPNIHKWLKYIQFYLQRCIEVQLEQIQKDQKGEDQMMSSYGGLPILFIFIYFNEQEKAKFQLMGTRQLYSRERSLEKIITNLQNQIQSLKEQRQADLQKIDKLEKRNLELEEQVSRLNEQQPLRKKIHVQHQEDETIRKSIRNQRFDENEIIPEEPRNDYYQNFFKEQESLESRQQGQIQVQRKTTHEEYKMALNQQSSSGSNSNSSSDPNVHINENKQPSKNYLNSSRLQNPSQFPQSQQQSNIQPNLRTSQVSQVRREESYQVNSTKISEEKLNMIKRFSKHNCYLTVSYEANNERKGFCCVFCTKVFKEDEFLFKHLINKHGAEVNHLTTEKFLLDSLTSYNKLRSMKTEATKLVSMMDKRSRETMNESLPNGNK